MLRLPMGLVLMGRPLPAFVSPRRCRSVPRKFCLAARCVRAKFRCRSGAARMGRSHAARAPLARDGDPISVRERLPERRHPSGTRAARQWHMGGTRTAGERRRVGRSMTAGRLQKIRQPIASGRALARLARALFPTSAPSSLAICCRARLAQKPWVRPGLEQVSLVVAAPIHAHFEADVIPGHVWLCRGRSERSPEISKAWQAFERRPAHTS